MEDLIIVNDNKVELAQGAIDHIMQVELEIKALKELQDTYKEELLNAMEDNDILKIDMDQLSITRKSPTTRETFDSKALREESPDIYDKYVKMSDVKGSITIKVK